MALSNDSLVRFVQGVALGAALIVPGAIYLLLAYEMPLQYQFVIANAAERVWPLTLALMVVCTYLLLTFLLIRALGYANRLFISLAFVPPLGFLVSVIAAAKISVPTVLVGAGLVLALAALLVIRNFPKMKVGKIPANRQAWVLLGLALGLYLVVGVATAISAVNLPRSLGSTFLLTLALGTLGVLLCFLALRPKVAAIAGVYLVVATLFFGSNGHGVPTTQATASPREVADVFGEWLSSRQDLAAYRDRNKPYPVILVSSEGGGIYAAAHAYGTLSTIQRHCAVFGQHVFAAVGVSGGALGNLLFAGSVDPTQRPHQPCRYADGVVPPTPVTTDHLSPVLARLLLLEPLDRLIPGRLLKRDRAQILSDSFLDIATDKVFANRAITDSFTPSGARPAVISVAVNVGTGRRVVLSPFHPDELGATAQWWPSGAFRVKQRPADQHQISLVDAAGLSARFPWITPTGRLHATQDEEIILADGGYFENSGADTVFDLIIALKIENRLTEHFDEAARKDANAYARPDGECDGPGYVVVGNFHEDEKTIWTKCKTPIFLIHFAIASAEPEVEAEGKGPVLTPKPDQSLLADPLYTLLATRRTRGEIALRHMDVELCGSKLGGSECYGHPGQSFGMFRNDVAPQAWKLPLGWFMQQRGFERILTQTAPDDLFKYSIHKQEHKTDTELLIYHLDPALYDEGAEPSIDSLLGGP